MGLFRRNKKEKEAPVETKVEIGGSDIWIVSWSSLRDRGFHTASLVNDYRVSRAFLSESEALEFKNELENAMRLLQCTFSINITVEKQV